MGQYQIKDHEQEYSPTHHSLGLAPLAPRWCNVRGVKVDAFLGVVIYYWDNDLLYGVDSRELGSYDFESAPRKKLPAP